VAWGDWEAKGTKGLVSFCIIGFHPLLKKKKKIKLQTMCLCLGLAFLQSEIQ